MAPGRMSKSKTVPSSKLKTYKVFDTLCLKPDEIALTLYSMFLTKIQKLSEDFSMTLVEEKKNAVITLAREAMLYGMKLERKPIKLKRQLKKCGLDPATATQHWSGNHHLLVNLPNELSHSKRKILNLEDFLFARRALTPEWRKELRKRVENTPTIDREAILKKLIPQVKKRVHKGRFLGRFDPMYQAGHNGDIEQDLMVEVVAILNREWHNFNTTNEDDIVKYIGYCFERKGDTYLRSRAPKSFRMDYEDQNHFEKTIEQTHQELDGTDATNEGILAGDLKNILPEHLFKAVSLLMGFASTGLENQFNEFLVSRGKTRRGLTPTQFKIAIEDFCGRSVFSEMKTYPELISYLTA